MKNYIKKGVFLSAIAIVFSGIISCEKDFTDIGSSIVKNDVFNTKDTILEIEITNKPVTRVRANGLGQYLLGVYNNPNYEKIEASIVSQLAVPSDLSFVSKTYGADTTVVTTIDTVFIKIPYQATLKSNTSSGPEYSLDSIIGNQNSPFNLNIYRTSTYLNVLDPLNPSQRNVFYSDDNYTHIFPQLNETLNIPFIPNENDTVVYISRKLSTGSLYTTDTIKFSASISSKTPVPVAIIPLDKTKIKTLFTDKYDDPELATQDAFNNYFRGLIIEATEINGGSLISFDFNAAIGPSIEIYYTSTIIKGASTIIDTIKKQHSFLFSGIKNNIYKMTNRVYPVNNRVKLQGTAGSIAEVKILGTPNQLNELRAKNWLINDASLIFYVDQSVPGTDKIVTPYRLFLQKKGLSNLGDPFYSQIKDLFTEGPEAFGGKLEIKDDNPNKYVFRITDYISDLLSGDSDYNPSLELKVFNSTDFSTNTIDTIVKSFNWNPKVVTLLNHLPTNGPNGTKRAQLKISYTEKK